LECLKGGPLGKPSDLLSNVIQGWNTLAYLPLHQGQRKQRFCMIDFLVSILCLSH
jgi:hypothetical protein